MLVVLLSALLLAAAACTTDSSSEQGQETEAADRTTTTEQDPPDDEAPEPPVDGLPPEVLQALVDLGGRLAVTRGNEVWVTGPAGDTPLLIDGGGDVVAGQPVWSTDGASLAWSSVGPAGPTVAVSDGLAEEPPQSSPIEGTPAFYLQWSSVGDELAYLHSASDGSGVEAGVVVPGEAGVPFVVGAPLFVSWSPAADRIAAHIGGTDVWTYDRSGEGERLFGPTGIFAVPDWVDDDTLIVADPAGVRTFPFEPEDAPVVPVEGAVRMVLSPDGLRLAYSANLEGDPEGVAPLRVLELASGEEFVVSEDPVLAWEWSHNSERLAYLGAAEAGSISSIQAGPTELRWFFWADDVLLNATVPFRPSAVVVNDYLPFFEQYALSHHRWSPDGSGFAFAGTVEGESGVWVQFVDALVESFRVTDGDSVTWAIVGGGSSGGASIA